MFARTERLLLRPGWREDAPALAAAIADPAIAHMLGRVPAPYTLADAEHFLALPETALPRLLIFLVGIGAPRLAGGIGLHHDSDGQIELGYWISRGQWGRGLATEAGRALLSFADAALGLDRIVAGHFVGNPASGAVLRKLGFGDTGKVTGLYSLARAAIVPCHRFERVRRQDAGTALAA